MSNVGMYCSMHGIYPSWHPSCPYCPRVTVTTTRSDGATTITGTFCKNHPNVLVTEGAECTQCAKEREGRTEREELVLKCFIARVQSGKVYAHETRANPSVICLNWAINDADEYLKWRDEGRAK